MGYSSRVEGRIEIDPPLPWSAIEHSAFVSPNSFEVAYEVNEVRVGTPTGYIVETTATAIVPTMEGPYKAYDLDRELAAIVAQAAAAGAHMTGAIVRSGESQGDVERYVVDAASGRIYTERAELRWPDGTAVDLQ